MTLAVMALTLLLGLAEAIQDVQVMSVFPDSPAVNDVFLNRLVQALFWLAIAPFVAFFGQRFRPGVISLPRIVLVHLAVGVLIAGAAALLQAQLPPIVLASGTIVDVPFEGMVQHHELDAVTVEELPAELTEFLQTNKPALPLTGTWFEFSAPLLSGFLKYAVLAMFVMAFQLHRDVRDRQVHSDQLQNQLALAQLGALRMQLRPHFLFNTLNSISTLMPRDVEAARRMIGQLADLLRASFSETRKHETALQDEMELLHSYLSIQKTRFGDGLRIRFDIAPDVGRTLVPSFCLQPLVENAVVHGVSKRKELGTIIITAHREGADLLIEVSDDGVGAPDGRATDEGIGLRNTRERLAQLYGSTAGIEVETPTLGGFAVRLRIPFHEKPIDTLDG